MRQGAINGVEKRRLLAANTLLGVLSADQLTELAGRARVEMVPANHTLFCKGDPGAGMMAVIRGRVRISSQSAGGQEVVLNIIRPGEVFGELALLDGAPRTADATTMEASELLVLDRRDFLPFLDRHPQVCIALMRLLVQRLRQTSQHLEDVVFLKLPSLLAKRLLWLAERCGRPVAEGVLIDVRLSQQQLASLIGMTRESVNKQLGEWRQAGLIAIQDQRILIRNETELNRLADEPGE
jgi:CRP-like cAMP-binding protein